MSEFVGLMPLLETALAYLQAGLSVLPAIRSDKRPALHGWKEFTERLPSEGEVRGWFAAAPDALCIVTGAVSDNLELIDFDQQAALFDEWRAKIPTELFSQLVIERSQSGGRHVVYRSRCLVCGNVKLAKRPGEDGRPVTFIETRGEGGLFLCAPTEGYILEQGSFLDLPTLSEAERDQLLQAAWDLNEIPDVVTHSAAAVLPVPQGTGRPGDDFNERGDVLPLLHHHGWRVRHADQINTYLWRPGKTAGTQSASLRHSTRTLFVFSTNAYPFAAERAYGPFQVFSLLEAGGDFAKASGLLRKLGFGAAIVEDHGVDFSQFSTSKPEPEEEDDAQPTTKDPGPFPAHLLSVPGLIDELVAHNLATAFKPQPVLALAAAVSLMGTITGRKVRDEFNSRTNLYVLGVGDSGSGKNHARTLNQEALYQAGGAGMIGEGIASHAGLITALETQPTILFQLDEIGRFLKTLGDAAKNPHLYGIITVLMKLFTSSGSVYVGDVYADAKRNRAIDQPHVCVYGTTVPKSLYEGLTPDSVTDGFLSRVLIFEGDDDPAETEQPYVSIPKGIVEVVRRWLEYSPGGNLAKEHPNPTTITTTPEANQIYRDLATHAKTARKELGEADAGTLWTRAVEKARKLGLVYACSRSFEEPIVDQAAAQWACDVSRYLTSERMVWLVSQHVSRSKLEAVQKRLWDVVKRRGKAGMSLGEISNNVRWLGKKEREEVIRDLLEFKNIKMVEVREGKRGPLTERYIATKAL